MNIRVRASALLKEPHPQNYLVRHNVELPSKARAFVGHVLPAIFVSVGLAIAVLVVVMDNTPGFLFRPASMGYYGNYAVLSYTLKMIASVIIGFSLRVLITRQPSKYSLYYRRVPQGKVVEMYIGAFQSARVIIEGYTLANELRQSAYTVDRKYWDSLGIGDFTDFT